MARKVSLRSLDSGKNVKAGEQIVDTICTSSADGSAGKILEQIATTRDSSRICRVFSEPWENHDNAKIRRGVIKFCGRDFPLTVKIGIQNETGDKTLVLKDTPGTKCSMRPANGAMVLEVGDVNLYIKRKGQYAMDSDREASLLHSRIEGLAWQIVGSWVVHGQNWYDRKDIQYRRPWGSESKSTPETLYFEIIDGAREKPKPTIGELIERGCYRHTHAGGWDATRQSTIIAAMTGMPVTLHEFKEKGGKDICFFGDLEIGTRANIWGVYCGWNEPVRHSGKLGVWQDLAMQCSSPFSFHVQATRTIFPNARLDSDYILETVEQNRLMAVFALIALEQPDRFYRLIDEWGVTHKLTFVGPDNLIFGEHISFPRGELAENLLRTFLDLQMMQVNPGHRIDHRQRVVIDSHAYIIIEALARRNCVVHDLSGRYMHAYLTEGQDQKSHRARNERLFVLLRDIFGIHSVKFHIYPPLTYNSGIGSQYDAGASFFNKAEWLAKEVK